MAPLLGDRRVAAAAIESAERAVDREQILLANEMKKGLGLLATVASTAPFVGLLGTTIGIVNYFTGRLETVFSEVAYAGREMIDWMLKREALRDISSDFVPVGAD